MTSKDLSANRRVWPDRELTLVPKKGRPVTQCQHCRAERKKRSAHVSCDCAGIEKPHHSKEKCVHLREAEERAKQGFNEEPAADKAHLAAVAEEQGCCCRHGGKCTCAMTKRESDSSGTVTPPHGPAVKPRLETTKSEGFTTVFHNGHHKPVHRKNHLAHECGMPYKMPMHRAHTDQNVSAKARRSVDSLALDNNMSWNPSAFTPQAGAPWATGRRMSKSEQHSPKSFGEATPAGFGRPELGAIDFSSLTDLGSNQAYSSAASDGFTFTPPEPMSSVDDGPFDPWSNLPSAELNSLPNNNPFGVWPTNPDVTGIAQPALTAASSGTQSEVDEIPAMEDAFNYPMPSIQEDVDTFNFEGMQDFNAADANRRSLPANFFKSLTPGMELPYGGESSFDAGSKPSDGMQAFDFNEVWEGSNLPPVTDMPNRWSHGLLSSGRPSSRSPSPADNVLQSLFPEFDINGNYFGNGEQSFNDTGMKPVGSAALQDNSMSGQETSFQPQAWTDGSMSIPHDGYNESYDLDQDFSNPDFAGNWAQ